MKLYEIIYRVHNHHRYLDESEYFEDKIVFYMFGYSRSDVRARVKDFFGIMFDWAESNVYENELTIKLLPKEINQ